MKFHYKSIFNLFTLFALLTSLLGSALIVTPAYAASITVTTTDDELNSDSDCSLREAIQAANTDFGVDACVAGSGADTISLPAGTYTLTIPGAGENTNATGDLDIIDSVTIDGAGPNASDTIIQAGTVGYPSVPNGIDRVFDATAVGITLSISDVTIANGNCADTGCSGGGIYFHNGTLTVTNSAFSGNSAADGGGIFPNLSTLNVTNSTFSNNSANYGGGIINFGTLTVTNSTFSGNSATNNGGGIYNIGTLTVTNSTFSGNSATNNGGGIYNIGTLHLKNTLLANSTSGGDCYNNGGDTIATDTNNLIEINGPSGNMCGTPVVTTDPALGTLTGSPAYFPLNSGSPAINAGDDTICAAAPVNNTSQNGLTRPQGAHCEIGSFEFEFSTSTTMITSDMPDPSRVGQAVLVTATVSGGASTPTGTVGISGADTNCTITLSSGNGSCFVNFASPGPKTLSATYNGDGSHDSSSDTEAHIAALVANFRSNGAEDGWILESGENTNAGGTMNSAATTLRMGDDVSDRQYRSMLSFNTASLPNNAVIASILLQTTWQSSVGNPNFTDFGGRSFVDVKTPTFGAASLELTDFITSPTVIAAGHQTTPIGNLYRAYFNAASLSSINLGGLTQIRIRFKFDDDDDGVADYFSFYSGNAAVAADRPLLQILYYTP